MSEELFELKDIEPQLTIKQKEYFEKIIFMAKELKEPQEVQLGSGAFRKRIAVFPSGKLFMMKAEWKCTKCGQPVQENQILWGAYGKECPFCRGTIVKQEPTERMVGRG